MNKGLCALAFGTFGLGVTEFVMMAILPDVAHGFGISISKAGHLISAYALGVCVGAPLIAMYARNWPLRRILVMLMGIYSTGALWTTLSPTSELALIARFITGIPHGAFFGVGVIVANRLAKEGKGASSVALMVMGMTVANLVGVPLCSWLSHQFSWRVVFAFATVWGGVTVWALQNWIPELPALPRTPIGGMFRFLKRPQPWMLLTATTLANAGVFCWYSYINPLLTEVSGFRVEQIPTLMLLAGASMCLGNYLGGRLADRFTPGRVALCTQGLVCVTLLIIFCFAAYPWMAVGGMCVATACLFGVSSPQQQLILTHSPGGEMMGGAMVQLAFNLGNAVGAYAGGLTLLRGMEIQATAAIGSLFALGGTMVLVVFCYPVSFRWVYRTLVRVRVK